MSGLPKTHLTPEQYLEIERAADSKSEYFRGEMFAMSGAREPHVVIVFNTNVGLGVQLLNGSCMGYSNDMRVRVAESELYTYPDIMIACREPVFLDDKRDTLLNPTLVVEVLPESTEAYDRGKKFEFYRTLESLQEYVLISSLHLRVERFTKQMDGSWIFNATTNLSGTIELKSIDCRLALADVYDGVSFTAHAPGAESLDTNVAAA